MTRRIIVIISIIAVIIGTISYLGINNKESLQNNKPRAGNKHTGKSYMKILSSVFQNNKKIPSKYTCDGADINPPLDFSGIPKDAKSLVLIVDDPDAPIGDWVHWMVWNIDPSAKTIGQDEVPEGAVVGKNDFGKNKYGGPCPGQGTHRYQFKLYALDTKLDFNPNTAKKADLEKAMSGHILNQGLLVGLYNR